MPIEPGQELLHYRLIEKIGEGGMGVVWKAEDTNLDRQVAIKVLPEDVAADEQRLARLEREAKLAASLNHPNIATVHGLHQADKIRFVAMELVEGDDLAERLAHGPLEQNEALEIARQIAEGLEAAHAAGVIHRDLKPANVKVAAGGRVKVLDFGLARPFDTKPVSGEVRPTMSPTVTSDHTKVGTVLGTAAYMSPEQARGQAVDSRTDIWAFGVVLYEMLSGRSPFKGDTVSDTLASVLKVEPDYDSLSSPIPNRISRLVKRCLQKDPRKRLHHIADARIVIEETLAGTPDDEPTSASSASSASSTTPTSKAPRKTGWGGWIAIVSIVALAMVATAWNWRPQPDERQVRKFKIALDVAEPTDPKLTRCRISPDGKRIVYDSSGKVFVRDLDAWESREIPAAEDATELFWSPDSTAIGFLVGTTLSRVDVDGSQVAVISELPDTPREFAWGQDGKIFITANFNDRDGLYEVPERGGEPQERYIFENEDHFHGVAVLPDNRGLVVTVHRGASKIVSVLVGETLTPLITVESRYLPVPVYSASGHILYVRGANIDGIWALPFSAETLEVGGDPYLVAASAGIPSVSDSGILIYRKTEFDPDRRLVWVDRKGEILSSIGQPQKGIDSPALSPDGKQVAFMVGDEVEADVWILDIERGTQTRVTRAEGMDYEPVWTPDGKRMVYRYLPKGESNREIRVKNAYGSGTPETLVTGGTFSLSRDGEHLLYTKRDDMDLWLKQMNTQAEPTVFLSAEAEQRQPRISPDMSTVAYVSNDSGRSEIYLTRFPSAEGRWQVSVEGGRNPRWSPKGDELFWSYDGKLMVAAVQTSPSVVLGAPQELFTWVPPHYLRYTEYAVAADGQRFVMVARTEEEEEKRDLDAGVLMLVENWWLE